MGLVLRGNAAHFVVFASGLAKVNENINMRDFGILDWKSLMPPYVFDVFFF